MMHMLSRYHQHAALIILPTHVTNDAINASDGIIDSNMSLHVYCFAGSLGTQHYYSLNSITCFFATQTRFSSFVQYRQYKSVPTYKSVQKYKSVPTL